MPLSPERKTWYFERLKSLIENHTKIFLVQVRSKEEEEEEDEHVSLCVAVSVCFSGGKCVYPCVLLLLLCTRHTCPCVAASVCSSECVYPCVTATTAVYQVHDSIG